MFLPLFPRAAALGYQRSPASRANPAPVSCR